VPAYVTAYEHFNERRSILKMTTGSANLDSLIDSIQEGQFYLFYGSNKTVLDKKQSSSHDITSSVLFVRHILVCPSPSQQNSDS
jgi:hypothetical protein